MALRLVDIIFFFAVLILMILIVTLIYFIKINKDEEPNKNDLEETQEMKIAKELRDSMRNSEPTIKFTDYEKDQEDKAIISYDELLKRASSGTISYESEEDLGGIRVGKVDTSKIEVTSEEMNRPYYREEAFLSALKEFRESL